MKAGVGRSLSPYQSGTTEGSPSAGQDTSPILETGRSATICRIDRGGCEGSVIGSVIGFSGVSGSAGKNAMRCARPEARAERNPESGNGEGPWAPGNHAGC